MPVPVPELDLSRSDHRRSHLPPLPQMRASWQLLGHGLDSDIRGREERVGRVQAGEPSGWPSSLRLFCAASNDPKCTSDPWCCMY